MEIERYIPEGRAFAISRKELKRLLGRDDWVIREWIKQANRRLEAEGIAWIRATPGDVPWRNVLKRSWANPMAGQTRLMRDLGGIHDKRPN